jgi:hypothetical protein
MPYKTGFCGIGCHEGTKPRSYSGTPMKTCTKWQECSCDCHVQITRMFEMADLPRVVQENPEYVPPKHDFWMPSLEERAAARAALLASASNGASIPTEDDDAPATAPLGRSFAPTPTGRAARGELEAWVLATCQEWVAEGYKELATPMNIGHEIGRREGINPPSVGAIGAVFDRWVAMGFAICERKPVRFIKFTEEGKRLGLYVLKEKYKLKSKSDKQAALSGRR